MNTLFLIPARAGYKGLPGKNIKLLNNKHLFLYSFDFVREIISVVDCAFVEKVKITAVIAMIILFVMIRFFYLLIFKTV